MAQNKRDQFLVAFNECMGPADVIGEYNYETHIEGVYKRERTARKALVRRIFGDLKHDYSNMPGFDFNNYGEVERRKPGSRHGTVIFGMDYALLKRQLGELRRRTREELERRLIRAKTERKRREILEKVRAGVKSVETLTEDMFRRYGDILLPSVVLEKPWHRNREYVFTERDGTIKRMDHDLRVIPVETPKERERKKKGEKALQEKIRRDMQDNSAAFYRHISDPSKYYFPL